MLTQLHLALYTHRPDSELDDDVKAEMHARHCKLSGPTLGRDYIKYGTPNHIAPPISDEDRTAWTQFDWPPVAECDMNGDDKLTLFRWPDWGPYRYEGALEIYERQQEQERDTAAGLWWSYAAALESLSDSSRDTRCREDRETDQDGGGGGGGGGGGARKPRHCTKVVQHKMVPPEMRRVGVKLWNSCQPRHNAMPDITWSTRT